MGAVAPVAQVNAELFGKMATTFGAIDRNPPDLKATIAESPSTLAGLDPVAEAQQPLLTDLTTFGQYMTPATQSLEVALPVLNPALEQGTQVLGRTPALNARLQQAMQALQTLAAAPGTNVALNALRRHGPDAEPDGPVPRAVPDGVRRLELLVDVPVRAHLRGDRVRVRPARAARCRPTRRSRTTSAARARPRRSTAAASIRRQGGNEYLHGQAYGAAVDNQGNADCETGQRGYPLKLN